MVWCASILKLPGWRTHQQMWSKGQQLETCLIKSLICQLCQWTILLLIRGELPRHHHLRGELPRHHHLRGELPRHRHPRGVLPQHRHLSRGSLNSTRHQHTHSSPWTPYWTTPPTSGTSPYPWLPTWPHSWWLGMTCTYQGTTSLMYGAFGQVMGTCCSTTNTGGADGRGLMEPSG